MLCSVPRHRRPYAARHGRSVSLLLVWGVTLVTFVLTNLVPSNPAAAALGERAASDPAAVAAFNHQYGLDRSLPVQYGLYLKRLTHLDLGTSTQSHNPVSQDLGSAFPATAELALTALIIATVVGVALGLLAALHHRKLADQVIRIFSAIGISTPTFWLALIVYYLFFYKLGWAPGSGRLDAQFSRRRTAPVSTPSTHCWPGSRPSSSMPSNT